jgi:hypothetical protein
VEYPNYDQITDPRPTLPPEAAAAVEPWFEASQRAYRAFRQRFRADPSIREEEPAIIIQHASDVFCVLVVPLMKDRPAGLEEFRHAIGSAAETAFRYAHFLYRDVQGGRMLGLWHRDIRNRLFDLAKDADDWWWNTQIVPAVWERFVGAGGVPVPAILEAEGVSASPSATEAEGGDPVIANSTPESAVTGGQDRRAAVDAFIEKCFSGPQVRVTRTMIWRSLGYKYRSEFERWENNHVRATKRSAENFARVLSMPPVDFVNLLKRRSLLP